MTESRGRLPQRRDCPRQSGSAARQRHAANMEPEEILRMKSARTDGYAPQEVLAPPSAALDMRPPAGTQGFFPRPPGLRGRMEGSHHYFTLAPAELASHSFPGDPEGEAGHWTTRKQNQKMLPGNKKSEEVKHLPLDYHYSVRS